MMKSTLLAVVAALAVLATAQWERGGKKWHDRHHRGKQCRGMWHMPGRDFRRVPEMGNGTFSQLIDHNDPSLGTFEQWYMYTTKWYKGPGSPVVLFTPGEVNATGYDSYLTLDRTPAVLAKEIGAAVIVLEHRYWGTSTPFTDLTTENMKYLTLENSIYDLTNFAKTAELPFDRSGRTNAESAPWVFIGGSYSGALAAWTESVAPGTFWAYQCSSGPVQAISDYWAYFTPVQLGMPKNCSKDVNLVINHMDDVLTTGSEDEVMDLKAMFGLESIEHNDDFMAALEWGPWLWQSNQFDGSYGFYDWCDFVENAVAETNPARIPGEEGVGLEKALQGFAKWSKDSFFPDFCQNVYGYFGGGLNTECFDTYNKSNPIFTDTTLSNIANRQWIWMTCNEPFGYWQSGAPPGHPTLVSRLVDAEYWIRQCGLYFPPGPNGETFGINKGVGEADVNAYTGGWSPRPSKRLQYTNGDFDPWREASVSSDFRPGGPLESTEQVPVQIVPGGFHVSDFVTDNGKANAAVQRVIDAEVKQLAEWVREWPGDGRRWRA